MEAKEPHPVHLSLFFGIPGRDDLDLIPTKEDVMVGKSVDFKLSLFKTSDHLSIFPHQFAILKNNKK